MFSTPWCLCGDLIGLSVTETWTPLTTYEDKGPGGNLFTFCCLEVNCNLQNILKNWGDLISLLLLHSGFWTFGFCPRDYQVFSIDEKMKRESPAER